MTIKRKGTSWRARREGSWCDIIKLCMYMYENITELMLIKLEITVGIPSHEKPNLNCWSDTEVSVREFA